MSPNKPLLSIVVPVFNEEESIGETVRRLSALSDQLQPVLRVEVIFVDDGSKDNSLKILKEFGAQDSQIKILSFSRNFGHQIAVTAGIDIAFGDYVAIIDGDLQDPPELIAEMYERAQQGYDVVYGKRRSRAGESAFKKMTAAAFYSLLSYMCETEIPKDTGDFRLMSRRAVDALRQLRERHRFIRGMVPWVGFKSSAFEYDRQQRFAGETKYPLRKMISFAANAVLSFSRKPLTVATRLGFFTILAGMFGGAYMLYLKLFTAIPVQGLTVLLLTIVFFGGIQILLIGIIGEYIARIFEEAKGRPLYIIAESINT